MDIITICISFRYTFESCYVMTSKFEAKLEWLNENQDPGYAAEINILLLDDNTLDIIIVHWMFFLKA